MFWDLLFGLFPRWPCPTGVFFFPFVTSQRKGWGNGRMAVFVLCVVAVGATAAGGTLDVPVPSLFLASRLVACFFSTFSPLYLFFPCSFFSGKGQKSDRSPCHYSAPSFVVWGPLFRNRVCVASTTHQSIESGDDQECGAKSRAPSCDVNDVSARVVPVHVFSACFVVQRPENKATVVGSSSGKDESRDRPAQARERDAFSEKYRRKKKKKRAPVQTSFSFGRTMLDFDTLFLFPGIFFLTDFLVPLAGAWIARMVESSARLRPSAR